MQFDLLVLSRLASSLATSEATAVGLSPPSGCAHCPHAAALAMTCRVDALYQRIAQDMWPTTAHAHALVWSQMRRFTRALMS